MITTVYIFRHGETDWNLQRKLQGMTNVPLNDTGRAQAIGLAQKLKQLGIELIVSSDLMRAADTARVTAQWTGAPIVIHPGLRETNLGKAEGISIDDVKSVLGAEALERWMSIKPEDAHYSFADGESKHDHRVRLFDAMETSLRRYRAKIAAISTHGGAMRRILHHIRPELKEPVLFPNCGVYKFEFNLQTGEWKHLEPQKF